MGTFRDRLCYEADSMKLILSSLKSLRLLFASFSLMEVKIAIRRMIDEYQVDFSQMKNLFKTSRISVDVF